MTIRSLSAKVEKSISLFLTNSRSDKEYHLYLCAHADSTYSVHAEYGRRSVPSSKHDKTAAARVGTLRAHTMFREIETEKRHEGYKDMPSLRPPASIPSTASILPIVSGPDPSVAALASALVAYRDSSSEISDAMYEAIHILRKMHGVAKIGALDAVTTTLVSGLLGDIACASQDYISDAIPALALALAGGQAGMRAMLKQCTPAGISVFESARDLVDPDEALENFLFRALEPVRNLSLL